MLCISLLYCRSFLAHVLHIHSLVLKCLLFHTYPKQLAPVYGRHLVTCPCCPVFCLQKKDAVDSAAVTII